MLRSKGMWDICAAFIGHGVSNEVNSRANDMTGMDKHQQVGNA